jgi:hypothetical protein
MFEAIAHILPPYQRIYETCRRNAPDSHTQAGDHDLTALMSYVYADLVRLCLELCQTFCRGIQGMSAVFQLSQSYRWTGSPAMSALKAPLSILLVPMLRTSRVLYDTYLLKLSHSQRNSWSYCVDLME